MRDELADRDEQEFPQEMWEDAGIYANDEPSRRKFLQVMGASMALAGIGLTGCKRPEHHLLPYNDAPAEVIEGKSLYFATTYVLGGDPIGVLAETHEGRPTKVEGNPKHPNSLGRTHVFAQASVLDLYNPARARTPSKAGQPTSRNLFLADLDKQLAELKKTQGAGLAILSEDYASPAVEMLQQALKKSLPKAQWYTYESAPRSGSTVDFSKADIIVSLDFDLLGMEDRGILYRSQFAARRQVDDKNAVINRLYVAEPAFTVTGLAADHRLRIAASQMSALADALADAVEGKSFEAPAGVDEKWIEAVAEDLLANKGRAIVMAGRRHAGAWAAVDRINKVLGSDVRQGFAATAAPLQALVASIGKNEVTSLVILGGNPVYGAPADLDVATVIKNVPWSAHLSVPLNETSKATMWHIPGLHYLENWGDARTVDGVVSPIQPMIEPLFGGMSHLELIARLASFQTNDPYQIARQSFGLVNGGFNEKDWRNFLNEGVWQDKRSASKADVSSQPEQAGTTQVPDVKHLELCFALDESVYDGRFAANGWMQECPDPVTKLTWDNAALLSPRTARELGVDLGDILKIELEGRSIEIAALPSPGMADYSLTLPLGYGRTEGGPLAKQMGFDVSGLRTTGAMWYAVGATASKTGKRYPLATTQEHWTIGEHELVDRQVTERNLVRGGTLDEYRAQPDFATHEEESGISLPIYTPPPLTGKNQWGMAVDLTSCIGCNACVVACQAENNIPLVGKDEVIRGREMHWMRIDRYFHGADPLGDVSGLLEPMMCQHCENAPCEPVCPVNATVHDQEGLNGMVYNRCVGTRYCSNNCPYKVRRFNYFDWNKGTIYESDRAPFDGSIEPNPLAGFSKPQSFQPPMQELLKMQKNPDVTVRMRGVMEKCTFCVQRIKQAEVETNVAAGQGEPGLTTNVVTACQQACPTQAITFGNLNDPDSEIVKKKASPRNYAVLGSLNTKPRTTYLARIRNVNPKLGSLVQVGTDASL